MTTWEDRWFE